MPLRSCPYRLQLHAVNGMIGTMLPAPKDALSVHRGRQQTATVPWQAGAGAVQQRNTYAGIEIGLARVRSNPHVEQQAVDVRWQAVAVQLRPADAWTVAKKARLQQGELQPAIDGQLLAVGVHQWVVGALVQAGNDQEDKKKNVSRLTRLTRNTMLAPIDMPCEWHVDVTIFHSTVY
mmetsp:Transcript_21181/g.54231  ORF Transcript_21181/g.54231 Transcript_21181/m.54231 type:complete len:177 (+) Transcript_21181:928-1458(+)